MKWLMVLVFLLFYTLPANAAKPIAGDFKVVTATVSPVVRPKDPMDVLANRIYQEYLIRESIYQAAIKSKATACIGGSCSTGSCYSGGCYSGGCSSGGCSGGRCGR